jgi:hypothetical protein
MELARNNPQAIANEPRKNEFITGILMRTPPWRSCSLSYRTNWPRKKRKRFGFAISHSFATFAVHPKLTACAVYRPSMLSNSSLMALPLGFLSPFAFLGHEFLPKGAGPFG